MKTGLIIFGVIFLVIGILLYIMPMQQIKADTTTVGNGNVDSRTSTARLLVPIEWAYASMIIGAILLILGLIIPNTFIRIDSRDSRIKNNSKKDSYEKTVESKEDIRTGDGKKHEHVKVTTEKHHIRTDEDDDL